MEIEYHHTFISRCYFSYNSFYSLTNISLMCVVNFLESTSSRIHYCWLEKCKIKSVVLSSYVIHKKGINRHLFFFSPILLNSHLVEIRARLCCVVKLEHTFSLFSYWHTYLTRWSCSKWHSKFYLILNCNYVIVTKIKLKFFLVFSLFFYFQYYRKLDT